jgi:hypothetical protein
MRRVVERLLSCRFGKRGMSGKTAALTRGDKGQRPVSAEANATRRTRPVKGGTVDAATNKTSDGARASDVWPDGEAQISCE